MVRNNVARESTAKVSHSIRVPMSVKLLVISNKMKGQITKVKDEWYQCTIRLAGGQLALGYGRTHTEALNDCFRDVQIVINLSK